MITPVDEGITGNMDSITRRHPPIGFEKKDKKKSHLSSSGLLPVIIEKRYERVYFSKEKIHFIVLMNKNNVLALAS